MSDIIALIENLNDTVKFKQKISKDTKIFSFNFNVHKLLQYEKIHHYLAEDYMTSDERLMVFDLAISYHNWFEDKEFLNSLNFEGHNLLGILDTAELHMLLIHHLRNFLMIKRIIEKENPRKIIVTKSLHDILIPISQKYHIKEVVLLSDDTEYHLEWDRIEIKFKLGNKPVSFRISRSTYNKIKSMFENVVCTFFNLWAKPNTKKTLLFLEINPSAYSDLLNSLREYDQNVIFFNQRRSAIWNIRSINLLKKNNCKLLNTKKIEKNHGHKITELTNYYINKLEQLWSSDDLLNIFVIEGLSLWPAIKQKLFATYKNRLKEYLSLIITTKNLFQVNNISCILCSNVFGETEKTILNVAGNSKPSILLEHGYANYTEEIERFDALSMYDTFRDKIAVWGETQKNYLVKQKHIDPTRIIVTGSPRHDSFFVDIIPKKPDSNTTVLLTIHSINQVSGQADTRLYVEFENLLRKICTIIKEFKNVDLVVKLHPNQDSHNQDIKKLIGEIDGSIPIYQLASIKELLVSSDVLVNISPEGFDPSTVLLESLILGKPTMNIVIDNKFYDFQYEKDNAIISISADSDLKKHLHDLVFNKTLQNKLIVNGKNHVNNYLANHGTASNSLAKYLTTF